MAVSDTHITVAPEVRQFVAQTRPMLINGQWVQAASGKTFEVHDPATGELIGTCPEFDAKDTAKAVEAAQAARCEFWAGLAPRTQQKVKRSDEADLPSAKASDPTEIRKRILY